jgi:hypothetical protein
MKEYTNRLFLFFTLFAGANIIDTMSTIAALQRGLGTEANFIFWNLTMPEFAMTKMIVAFALGAICFASKELEVLETFALAALLFSLNNLLSIAVMGTRL